jgi:hypothetical protein
MIIIHAFKAVICHVMKLVQNIWNPMKPISRQIITSAMDGAAAHETSAKGSFTIGNRPVTSIHYRKSARIV